MNPYSAQLINAAANGLKAANDSADDTAIERLQSDIKTLCLRHGKSRVINAFLDAWRKADSEGAKW